ncbi:IolE/MocC family protein [Psychrobacillus glaciei]|nr:hypothetical protein [Psychrobacillus glaciei]
MMKNSSKFVFVILFLSFFLSGCNQHPKINIGEALTKSEEEFKKEGIECVSAFDGEKIIKFRLLLKEPPTNEEATNQFKKILDIIATHSNNNDIWDIYNADFDLSYEDNVIYEGKKDAGNDLKVKAH